MEVYQILCLLGLPSLVSGAVVYCVKKIVAMIERIECAKQQQIDNSRHEIEKIQNRIDLLEHSQQAQLRDSLIANYEKYAAQGSAPLYAKDNFENCWMWYHSLGANGVMDDIHAKFMALPIHPEGDDLNEN